MSDAAPADFAPQRPRPLVGWFFRLLHDAGALARRVWTERNAAFRALAPSWPVALCVTVCALAFTMTAQGREVLLVTAQSDDAWKLGVFAIALTFTSVALMLMAVFVMSAHRPNINRALLEETKKGQPRFPEDPIHSSSSLRTRAAFVLGVTVPLSVFWVFARPAPEAPYNGWQQLGTALATGAAAYLAACAAEHFFHYRLEGQRKRRARAQAEFAEATNELARLEFNRTSWAKRPATNPKYEAPGMDETFWDRQRRSAEWQRSSAWLWYKLLSLAHWFTKPPTRWVLVAAAAMICYAQYSVRDGEVVRAAEIVTVGGAIAAYIFLHLRNIAMREVDTNDHRHLVVDRRVQAMFRGLSFVLVLVAFYLLWAGYDHPWVHHLLGPATVVLMGLFIVVNVLTWFVRSALGPPPTDRPPPRGKGKARTPERLQSRAEKFFEPISDVFEAIGGGFGWLAFRVGRFAEMAQGFLQPQRVLALGLWFFLVDKLTLPFLEGWHHAPGNYVTWALTAFTFIVAISLTYWFVAIVRPPSVERPKRKDRTARSDEEKKWPARLSRWAGVVQRAIFPPMTHAVRFPSWVLLAPFLFAALGENHELARIAVAQNQPTPSAVGRAEAWMRQQLEVQRAEGRVQTTAGSADVASIPAIIVLAEGGGIRAASHTGQLLDQLDRQQSDFAFFPNVFAISGVSGGAIGASAYLAERADPGARRISPQTGKGVKADYPVRAFLSEDLLTPLLAGLFASDFVTIFAPVNLIERLDRAADPRAVLARQVSPGRATRGLLPSRGDFFERAMARAWVARTGGNANLFDERMEDVIQQAAGEARPPVVMFNTFSADDGMLAAASNAQFENCPEPARPSPDLGLVTVQDCLAGDRPHAWTLPFSTAAHVSARFPVSNPPGLIDAPGFRRADQWEGWRQRRFVDGGYIDNSGAAAAAEAVQALRDAARKPAKRLGEGPTINLRIVVLHIFARSASDHGTVALGRSGAFNEVSAPASGFWQARERSGRLPTVALCQLISPSGADAEACARLARQRAYAGPGDVDDCRVDSRSVTVAGVAWINAPLCVSTADGAVDNYLLGWLMSDGAHEQIGDDMRSIGGQVLDGLAVASGARENTTAVPPPSP